MAVARALISIFILAAWLQSAPRGVIEGRLTDSTGGALPGAYVTLLRVADPTNVILATQRSDVDGRFRFDDVPAAPGLRYVIETESSGFEDDSRVLSVEAGQTTAVEFKMRLGCFGYDLVGLPYDRDRFRKADAVVYVRIARSYPEEHWRLPPDYHCEVLRQHTATVLGVARLRPVEMRGSTEISLLEDLPMYDAALAEGREYLLPLHWEPEWQTYIVEPVALYEVEDQRLASAPDIRGIRGGMRISDVLDRLRGFLGESRR